MTASTPATSDRFEWLVQALNTGRLDNCAETLAQALSLLVADRIGHPQGSSYYNRQVLIIRHIDCLTAAEIKELEAHPYAASSTLNQALRQNRSLTRCA